MTQPSHRCRSCGVPLAQDNTSGQCGPCQAADRARAAAPPVVPPGFWETKDMQRALQSCHMGKVIRAFREHLHHGRRGYSQSDVAAWAHTSQARISRIENGPPVLRLDHLDYWAKLLGIPQEHLWFKLPENRGPRAVTPVDWALEDGEHQAAPHEDTSPHETGLSWGTNDGAAVRRAVTGPPQRSGEVEGESDDARIGDAPRPEGDRDLTPTLPNPPIHIDIETAQPARMGDYLSGGGANFSVDREATDYIAEAVPGGIDVVREMVQANRSFVDRAVRFLGSKPDIRQFLDIGTRMPTAGNKTHEVALEIKPDVRFVYVIEDPVVLAHAHTLRAQTPEGGVAEFVRGSVREPEKPMREASSTLDFTEPIAVVIRGGLVHIPDDASAQGLVRRVLDAVPSGSYLVMTHIASDIRTAEVAEALRRLDVLASESKLPALTLRTRGQMSRFFEDLELLPPGLVPTNHWDGDDVAPPSDDPPTFMWGAVARKP